METVTFLLYTLKDVLVIFSITGILHFFFRTEYRKNKVIPVLILSFIIFYSAFSSFFLSQREELTFEYLDGVSLVVTELSLFLVLKKVPARAALLLGAVYIFTIDMLWSFMAEFFGQNLIAELIFNILICAGVSASLFFPGKRYGENVFSGVFHEIPRWIFFVLLFFEVTCYYREFGVSTEWYNFFYAVSACMVFICILYLIYRIFGLVLTQNSILRRLNEQYSFTAISEKSDNSLRAFRHDYKNHQIVLNSMFEQGDYEGAKRYFSALSDTISEDINRFSTGNTVVNSLLTVKKTIAGHSNTEIVFDGVIPAEGIENNDMCTVVGNLLDNALEACEKLPEHQKKQILLHAHTKNNTLVMTIKNPMLPKSTSVKDGSTPWTSKKDIRAHGFGLQNVKRIIEKYDGRLTLTADEDVFTAELFMNLHRTDTAETDK